MRKKVEESHRDFFEYKKKEKDEYDKEYDKGKLKKIKKKKERKIIDFNMLEESLKSKKKSGYYF